MPHVNVKIAGRVYRMACGDGEEEHLAELAARLDRRIDELRGSFGEIGETRITVMAALTIADQLSDAERRIASLEADVGRLAEDLAGRDAQTEVLAEALADTLGTAAERIDRVARDLNAHQRG